MNPPEGLALLEPEQLAQRMPDPQLLLIQVTSAEVFAQAHLPGAVLVTPAQLVCGVPPATGRLPEPEQLAAMLGSIGYSAERDIVVYDDEGGGWAGRMAWTLDVIAKRQWSYLDGGLHSWAEAGLPLETGAFAPVAPGPEPLEIEIGSDPIAEIEDILAGMEDAEQVVWDVRSAEEYAGVRQASARSGHIPGAVNLDWLALQDRQRQLRLVTDLESKLRSLGLNQNKQIITHCHTHHRSGLSYMVGRLLG